MYIRPTGIATYGALGVGTAKAAKVFTITCPVGPYYPEGFAPVSLLAESQFVRAWPGGAGANKLGSYVPYLCPWGTRSRQSGGCDHRCAGTQFHTMVPVTLASR